MRKRVLRLDGNTSTAKTRDREPGTADGRVQGGKMAAKRSKNNNKTTEISGCIIRSRPSAKSLRGPSGRIRTGKDGKLCSRKDGTPRIPQHSL
ncbi:hypothetical protein [Sphingobacterium multivorum]|uniref:Uncharacterized protein n=1 Tax=Sphingobacterium multivorum TaxID=28454 RepID=A0ABX7CNX3_SPHMU|nr:hypothetical protein [Sphingobacterium multivorum]QQT30625.1 hypothetical protein I6I99_25605 [Sphingobacterium multivorum]QQT53398.1 hypothetical protein I6I98_24700 [Sphingobacterium multivorum]